MIDLASQDPSGHDGHTDAAGDQLQSQSHYNSNSQPSQPHLDMVQDMMKQAHITVQEDSYYESAGLDLALKFMNSDETLLQPSDEDKDEHEQYDGRSQPATAPKPGTPSKQANSSHAHNSTLERIASRLSLRSDGDSGSIGQRSSSLSQSHVRTQSQPQAVVQSSIAKPNSGSTNSIGQTKVRRKGMKFRQSFGNIKNVLSRTVSGEMSMETAAAVSGPGVADRSFKGPVALNPQGTPQCQAQGNTQGEYLQHSRGESSSAGSRSPTKAGSVSSGCTVLSMGTHGDNGAAKIDEFDEVRLDGDFDNNNTQAVSYTNSPEFDGQSPRIRHHKGHSADLHRASRHTTPRLSENTVRFSPQVNTEDDWKRKLFDGTAGGSSDEDEDEDNSNDRTALTTRNSLLYQSAAPRRVMTKAQFETFRKSMIGSPAFGSSQAKTGDESDESDGNSETDSADETAGLTGRRKKKKKNSKNKNNNNENGDDDDDDDDENDVSSDEESEAMRLKNLRQKFDDNTLYRQSVRMRMNQDAHLSVYRQKMMKLTGQNQSFTAQNRPHSAFVTSSVDLMAGGEDDDEDDEYDNVPLGILRAHGFPTGQHPLGTGHSMGKTAKPGDSLSVSNLNLSSGGGAGMGSGLDSPRPATLGYPGSGGGETRSIHSVDALSLNGPSNRRSFATLGNRRSILFGQNELTGAPRGLIGEIAREEEARMRRRSMAGLGGYFRSPSTTNLDEAGLTTNSVQQFSPSGNGPAKDLSSPGANDPIQLQLQQMMHMQYQMLATIQGQGGAPPGSPMSPSIYGVGPRSSQATLPRGRVPNQSQVSLPALNHMGSSYSIRTQHQQQQQQQPPMGRPFSQVNDTVDDNDDDDDDGFDDENAWRELEAKRQHIRQQWQAASATGSSPVAASSGSM